MWALVFGELPQGYTGVGGRSRGWGKEVGWGRHSADTAPIRKGGDSAHQLRTTPKTRKCELSRHYIFACSISSANLFIEKMSSEDISFLPFLKLLLNSIAS